jgi:hypothetical protein
MNDKIEWPESWNPNEGWATSIPGVDDKTVAKAVERLGGPRARTKTISMKAVLCRVNRHLAKQGEEIRKTRKYEPSLGDYFAVYTSRNMIAYTHVDPEADARKLGLVRPDEVVEG